MTAARQRIEAPPVGGLMRQPGPIVRVLAGRPIAIEGQTLDPHVQIAVKLERRTGGFEPAPVEEVRALRRHDAQTFRGPTIEVERVSELEIPGPAGTIGARLYVPAALGDPAPLIV